ncbi:MAG: bifunctional pyr operon transcriptional regulator/uracil phosphoribosyltransferase PyrR [Nitrospirae bacterium]|nr:MAG: bifunctional pyr operon transcriptional regulator/uracil phosphoribosyltransferase PyrR [Nitrospirota bacterium]
MKKQILDQRDIDRALSRIAHEIVEKNRDLERVCLIGIQRGGVHLSSRIAKKISEFEGVTLPAGSLDISLYRDDIGLRKKQPVVRKTEIDFDINDLTVILVDDVLFTGRSIRAAMDALMDIGRPARIQLAVLIDRGHRELPIRADYVGKNVPTSLAEKIEVLLNEEGHEDGVFLTGGMEKPDDK